MKRIEWVDTLKGIGIITVVIGHVYGGYIRFLVGLVGMPLFFCIGGFLYSPKHDDTVYFKNKIIHLIVPYISFIVILYPIQLLTILPPNPNPSPMDILKLILNPFLGGSYLWGLTTAFWFTPCFFMTQQLANWLIKKFSHRRQILVWGIVLLFIGYINSSLFQQFWLPQNANVAIAATPLFLLGYFYRSLYNRQDFFKINIVIFFSSLIFVVALGLIPLPWKLSALTFDMKRGIHGVPVISLLLSLCLIILLINLCIFLVEKIPLLAKFIGASGESSMVILFLHMAFIYALKFLDPKIAPIHQVWMSIALSFLCYLLFLKTTTTRAIFLGSSPDFKAVFSEDNKFVATILNKVKK